MILLVKLFLIGFGGFISFPVVRAAFGFNPHNQCSYFSHDNWFNQCECFKPNFTGLRLDLGTEVFGQPFASIVVGALEQHYNNPIPRKPLVFLFSGAAGIGKNFVSDFIIKRMFPSEHKLYTVYYHNIEGINSDEVQKKIRDSTGRCGRTVFVFDEVDKMDPKIFSSFTRFLDEHQKDPGLDYRRTVFIFLSNYAHEIIRDITFRLLTEGKTKSEFRLRDFEGPILNSIYYGDNGLTRAPFLGHGMVTYYIPFLPLTIQDVKDCVKAHLRNRELFGLAESVAFVQDVVSDIQTTTEMINGAHIFSKFGCRGIDSKTDIKVDEYGSFPYKAKEKRTEL